MATKFLKRHGRTTSEVIAVEQPSDTYTKLTNASAPRSRGQFWDDVTPEGGGGSAFAHLTEDAENSQIVADWMIVGTDATFGNSLSIGDANGVVSPHLIQATFNGLKFWDDWNNDNQPHLQIQPDGSLHWGDGAGAPDLALLRRPAGGLSVADSDDDGFVVSTDGTTDGDYMVIDAYGISFASAGNSDTSMFRAAAGIVAIAGNGGGFRLKSPDGTAYDVTVANGGAIAVAAV